jgi:glycogen debranching enzyme
MREWMISNRLGSFAMGTPHRQPERKYHGLLIVRQPGLTEPLHIVADVCESIHINGRTYNLACWRYPQGVPADGQVMLAGFEADPTPEWEYRIAGGTLRRRLTIDPDRDAVTIHYTLHGFPGPAEIALRPHFTARGVHKLGYENPFLSGQADEDEGQVFRIYQDFPAVRVSGEPQLAYHPEGFWNRNVEYLEEERRGYPSREDLFCPGVWKLETGTSSEFSLSIEALTPSPPTRLLQNVIVDDEHQGIGRAADAFLYIERESGQPGILAGYPWFGEWGRDSMIALPGLTLARGSLDLATAILDRYAGLRSGGLIPNLFGSSAETSDGRSVDASLWFIRAVQIMDAEAGKALAQQWFNPVFEILDTLLDGDVPGVEVTDDGLLKVDHRPLASGWMDALVNGHAVTPRAPFAVELNALFYNAMGYAIEAARFIGNQNLGRRWSRRYKSAKTAFRKAFWMEEEGYLADVSDGVHRDASLRPNQLLAAALPNRPVTQAMARSILDAIKPLVTPFGLRTLDPKHPDYRGQLVGDHTSRDLAYHQGTVWAWLIGPYLDAFACARGDRAAALEAARFRASFETHMADACIGQISEVFDGDEPHTPRGAPAQAWSVAELLRSLKQYRESIKHATRVRAKSKARV